MRRLLTIALLWLATTGCFEAENRLAVHADGKLVHTLRVGQPRDLMPNDRRQNELRWVREIEAVIGSWGRAWVDNDDSFRWYTLEAELLDVQRYHDYRRAYIEALEARYPTYGWLAPPAITEAPGVWLVELHDPGTASGKDVRVDAEDPRYFTFVLQADALGDSNADREEPGTLYWERPTGVAMQSGIRATAHIERPVDQGLRWLGLAMVVAVLLAGGVMVRSAGSAGSRT